MQNTQSHRPRKERRRGSIRAEGWQWGDPGESVFAEKRHKGFKDPRAALGEGYELPRAPKVERIVPSHTWLLCLV